MELSPLFPIAIGRSNIGRDFTQEELDFIRNVPKSNRKNSYMFSVDNQILKSQCLRDINDFIDEKLNEYLHQVYAPLNSVKLKITQSWATYRDCGQNMHAHNHANSLVSGVFYVDVENNDHITFHKIETNMLQFMPTSNFNMYNSTAWTHYVSRGDLIIFPSYVSHSVDAPNKNRRISIAFNSFIEGKLGLDDELNVLNIKLLEV